MSFSYDLSVAVGKLRLFLGDTTSTSYVFEDAELTAFLDAYGQDLQLARVAGLEVLATDHARRAVWYQVNGFQMDRRDPAKRLLELAKQVYDRVVDSPFEYESVLEREIDSAGRDQSNYMDTTA